MAMRGALFALLSVPLVAAQAAMWAQCGVLIPITLGSVHRCANFIQALSLGWTGPITCVAGAACVYQNEYNSRRFYLQYSTHNLTIKFKYQKNAFLPVSRSLRRTARSS